MSATSLNRFLLFVILLWQSPVLALSVRPILPKEFVAPFDSLSLAVDQQDFLTAFDYLNRLRSANSKNDEAVQAALKLREGQLYLGMQFFEKSEKCLLESAALFEKTKQGYFAGEAYYFLGGVMENQKREPQKQLEYFRKALPFYQKSHDTLRLVWTYDAIGCSLFGLGNVDEAINNSRLAATLMMTDSAKFYEPNVFTSLGECYLAAGDYETAQNYLEKSVNTYKNGFDTEGYLIYDAYRLLGTTLVKLGNREAGMVYLKEALAYCETHIDDPILVKETFKALIEEAKERGDIPEALRLQERYVQLRDSLSQQDALIKIDQNQTALAIGRAEKEQVLLKNQLLSNQKINQAMIFAAALMLCLLVALFSLYRQNQNFNKQLHLEVERKTQALQNSNAELERFAFVASHDLKTPIRNIISFSGLLERRMKGTADENTRQYLGFIRDYSYMMNNLVNNIITFSKIGESAQNTVSLVPISAVSDVVIENLKSKIEAAQAVVRTEGVLPDVAANQNHIEQLFQNLVDNALTYNDKAQPEVVIGALKNGQADRHLFVRDNGIGIDPQYQDKVFDMFSKLHSSKDYQGSGLGLAICKKIVLQYGGRIWMESEKGVGTTVHVVLPAEQAVVLR